MTAHTPGPWQRCGSERGGCICGHVWDATGNIHVATATSLKMARPDDLEALEVYVQSEQETKANARLIAAAPMLLSALEALIDAIDNKGARIESYTITGQGSPEHGYEYWEWHDEWLHYVRAEIAKATGP